MEILHDFCMECDKPMYKGLCHYCEQYAENYDESTAPLYERINEIPYT